MTTLAEQIANQIDRAADYIEANGWVQYRPWFYQPDGRVSACMVGALMRTCALNEAFVALLDHLGLDTDNRSGIATWNDTPGREVWEVVLAMRFAAKRVRSGDIAVSA